MQWNPELLTPRDELQQRIARLQEQLRNHAIDGALLAQNADLYYFSGTLQRAQLYLPCEGDPLLMVHKDLARARSESELDRVVPLSSPRRLPELLQQHGQAAPETLGLELDVLPAGNYLRLQQLFPHTRLKDVSPLVRLIRAVKSAYEIEKIRQAARLADEVAACVGAHLREGLPEVELAGRVEAEARKRGHQGIVRMRLWGNELFYGHLMAGPSAAAGSYLASPTGGWGVSPAVAQSAGWRPIGRNEPVLVDYVFVHQGYLADHARIFSLGPLEADLEAAHRSMLAVQSAIRQSARPGAQTGALYEEALRLATESGWGDCFMGTGPERVRFVGHGLGLELDEYPFLAEDQRLVLAEGMVLALEPKLVIPDRGVVGIENTFVVTADGLEQLTRFPEEICEI